MTTGGPEVCDLPRNDAAQETGASPEFIQMRYPLRYTGKPVAGLEPATLCSG
jgi:hypothetical protein